MNVISLRSLPRQLRLGPLKAKCTTVTASVIDRVLIGVTAVLLYFLFRRDFNKYYTLGFQLLITLTLLDSHINNTPATL